MFCHYSACRLKCQYGRARVIDQRIGRAGERELMSFAKNRFTRRGEPRDSIENASWNSSIRTKHLVWSIFLMHNRCLKLAAIVLVFRRYSDAQRILDRLLDGYGWNCQYHRPQMDLVALYVDQIGADDLTRERESLHPLLKTYRTITEALTLDGAF